tara:strand:+ start:65072 stop:68440 length:3369 start_codon:yes stop_codon:yes gene_type:complete
MIMRRGLGWMVGFPAFDGAWVGLPLHGEAAACEVGRTQLRRATYALGTLAREFPRVLPAIVGDVGEWDRLHRSLLAALKPSVHLGSAVPESALELHPLYSASARESAQRAMREVPQLTPLVNAFSWYCWLSPSTLRPAIAWLRKSSWALGIAANFDETKSAILVIRMWELFNEHGAHRLAPVLQLLAHPRLCTTPTKGAKAFVDDAVGALNWKEPRPLPKRPAPVVESELFSWSMWLVEQDVRTARRSIEILGLVGSSFDFDGWERWWRQAEELGKTGVRLRSRIKSKKNLAHSELVTVCTTLRGLLDQAPPRVHDKTLFELLRSEAVEPSLAQCRATRRGLQALPVFHCGAPIRIAFLAQWSALRREAKLEKHNRLAIMIAEFASLLERHDDIERVLLPWRPLWRGIHSRPNLRYSRYTLDSELLGELPRNAQVRDYYQALDLLQSETEFTAITDNVAEELVDVLVATGEPLRAVLALGEMHRAGLIEKYVSCEILSLAGAICQADVSQFAVVIEALLKADATMDVEGIGPRLLVYWTHCSKATLLQCVLDGHVSTLCETVLRCEAIRSVGGRVPALELPKVASAPRWIRRYPEELRVSLRALSSLDRNAEATAARILRKDIPDPESLRAQIAELAARIERGGDVAKLGARIRKLETWLKSPQQPKAGRLANLGRKLLAAGHHALVANWQQDVGRAFDSVIPRLLGVEVLPTWATEANVLELLLPINSLGAEVQALARELLRARVGAPPWDLRDRPENRRFLDSMAKRGIDMELWLDAAPVLRKTANEEELRITLERDPLEVFAMGKHFQTCLSPGSMNYFSVFANAADVNKQVLYARRVDGTVVARCLLALTAQGGMLAFHAYCHDNTIGFADIVKEYAGSLAKAMNTIVLAQGTVPTLVASRWYDDGAIDVSEQFAGLREKTFLEALEVTPLETVADVVAQALAPLSIDALTLPTVLGLAAFRSRPELILPLYNIILHETQLSAEHLVRVVGLLVECENLEEAARLAPRLVPYALAVHREARHGHGGHTHMVEAVIAVLAKCAPAAALGLLRKTRTSANRTWKAETDGARLYAGAVANFQLHRPAQAIHLLELGAKAECCTWHRAQCKELLDSHRHASS